MIANKLLYTQATDDYLDVQHVVDLYQRDILNYLEDNGFTVVNLFKIISELRQRAKNDE